MEIIVKINKIEDIYVLNNADGYLISNSSFSYRFDHSFTLNEIKKINKFCKDNNKKMFLLLNKIFKDSDIEKVKLFIQKTIPLNIDGYYFTDFAIFMILDEFNIANKSVFYHETFLRNHYDIETYFNLGINNIICSKDMNINDINNLNEKHKNNLGIICFGYIPLYESTRKVLTNFIKQNNLDLVFKNNHNLFLKEKTRDEFYRIIEQNGTTSIFASEVLCYIDFVKQLNKNINIFIIDALFFENNYIYQVIELFRQSLENNITIKDIEKLDNNVKLSSLFLNKRVDLK